MLAAVRCNDERIRLDYEHGCEDVVMIFLLDNTGRRIGFPGWTHRDHAASPGHSKVAWRAVSIVGGRRVPLDPTVHQIDHAILMVVRDYLCRELGERGGIHHVVVAAA